MAARGKKRNRADVSEIPIDTRVPEVVELKQEAEEAYLRFAATANHRMIPNVYDGLKPVHRRILLSLMRDGTRSNARFVKTMKSIGLTMGIHPHGDAGIADAFKTLTWGKYGPPIRINVPLLDGQGNWGSLDDEPAAPRYTECRLDTTGERLLGIHNNGSVISEIDEQAVNMVPVYSGESMEPTTLPALFPGFVVNNSDGIGAPIKSEVPGHNLREVMTLALRMVDTPNPRWSTITDIMPGPDLPCDCDIFIETEDGVPSYYDDGYGPFVMRARYTINRDEGTITFNGFPFRVSAEKVVEGIQSLVESGNLDPKVQAFNLSDADGMKVEVDCNGVDIDDTLQRLLFNGKVTRLQTQFNASMNAVVDGRIRMVGPIEGIRLWLSHRRRTIRARSKFRKNKAEARLEVVLGFLKAVPIAEEIVQIVRASDSKTEAAEEMIKRWAFTERQCAAILDMSISQITKLGVDRYENERDNLQELIDECNRILNDPEHLNKVLKSEIRAVRDELGVDRRCTIVYESSKVSRPERPAIVVPATPMKMAVSDSMWVKAGKRAPRNMSVSNDYFTKIIDLMDTDTIEAVSNMGYHYRIDVEDLPDKAVKLDSLFPAMDEGESIAGFAVSSPDSSGNPDILMVTNYGRCKRFPFEGYDGGRRSQIYQIFPLDEDERIVSVIPIDQDDKRPVAVVTDFGYISIVDTDSLSAKKSRSAAGMPLMRMSDEEAEVIWAGLVDDSDRLVYKSTFDDDAIGFVSISDIDMVNRNTRGRHFTKDDGYAAKQVFLTKQEDSLIYWFDGISDEPSVIDMSEIDLRRPPVIRRKPMLLGIDGIGGATTMWSEPTEEDDEE